jgi:hypothetical protein
MKKNIFLAVALLALITVGTFAQQYDSESDFQVTKVGNGIRITKYVGSKTVVNIPPTIQNTPVTQIGENAFANTKITSVTVPDGVTFIWDKAFFPCTELVSVTLNCKILQANFKIDAFPEYSLRIMFYQKNADDGTQGTYTRPNRTSPSWTLTQAAQQTQAATPATSQYTSESNFTIRKLTTGVTILKYTGTATVVNIPPTIENLTVLNIGANAFANTKITSVTMPNSVTGILASAFSGCTSLTSVIIPNSVTSIGQEAFAGCTSLTSVTFQGGVLKNLQNSFPGDLYAKFYATDKEFGTPGTYTRPNGSSTTWTKK